jgi:hypothetical protein
LDLKAATSFAGNSISNSKYSGAVLGPNDKLYCIPYDEQSILIIDLKTNNPMRAGYLSLYILWNLPSLKASIEDYKKRFGFE